MSENEQENTEDAVSFSEPTVSPSRRTILMLVALCALVIIAFFAYLALRMDTDPRKECAYRGGHWSTESGECVFQNGAGVTAQQVGMQIKHLEIHIPGTQIAVDFDAVDIGSNAVFSKTFVREDGGEGVMTLVNNVSHVQSASGDLILPFVVQDGGSASLFYMGIFEKQEAGYIHTDSVFVGDRIGPERIALAEHPDSAVYTVQFLYRDRVPSEPFTAIPREPKTLELDIQQHHIVNSFTVSREGVSHRGMITVARMRPRTELTSPVHLSGTVRTEWLAGDTISVELRDATDVAISKGSARTTKRSDINDFTDFVVDLSFAKLHDSAITNGVLLFTIGSAPREGGDTHSFEIPVRF